jgi:beta-phosphoglucomutase-like phosphatase (HAD superfamily)
MIGEGMPAVAIFDIDGTLVDTNYQHALAWYRAFRSKDVVISIWRIHRAIGIGSDRVVTLLAGEEVEGRLGEALRVAEGAEYRGFSEQELTEAGASIVFDLLITCAPICTARP